MLGLIRPTPMFAGTYVAAVTPFARDGGLDLEAFRWLLERFEEAGLTGVLVSGTTGEWPLLGRDERLKLFEAAVEYRSRLRILAGVSAASTRDAVELARGARDVGVDAVVATPPLYFRAVGEKLREHFLRVADAADKPLILYTIPSNIGYNISVEDVYLLATQHAGVAGIKATVDDLHYIHSLVSEVKPVRQDFAVLAGYGEYLLDALAAGGDGAIDAVANLTPKLLPAIMRAWEEGRYDDAVKLHRALVRLAHVVRRARSTPLLVKHVLSALGAPVKPVSRVPVASEDPQLVELIVNMLCSGYRDYLITSTGCHGR